MCRRREECLQDCLSAAGFTLSPTWICMEDPGVAEFIAGSGLKCRNR